MKQILLDNLNKFKNNNILIYILFIIIWLLLYGQTLNFDFIYDDHETIINNKYVHSLTNIKEFFLNRETTSPYTNLKYEIYRPFKSLLVALDYSLYKFNPRGFHLTNIILHLISVLLLYNLLLLLNLDFKISIISSIYFLIHPVLTHNVSYISGRADILSGLFILLAFIYFIKSNFCINKNYFFSNIFYIFALLSKETSIMFSLFLFFYILINKSKEFSKNNFIKKISKILFLPFIIGALYLFLRQYVVKEFAQTNYYNDSFIITQASMMKSWFIYILGIFIPLKTDIIPVFIREKTFLNYRTICSLIFIIFTLICIFKKRKDKLFLTFCVWFFLFLAPVSNIVPIKALMSWRFVYVSWIGSSIIFGLLINILLNIKKSYNLIVIIYFIYLSILNFQTTIKFENDLTLWQPLIIKHPTISKPYRVCANFYKLNKNLKKSEEIYLQGLQYNPSDNFLIWDIAKIYIISKKFNKALHFLNKIDENLKNNNKHYLYDLTYTLYSLEKYRDIIKMINFDSLNLTESKILFLQAHSLLMIKENKKAKELYNELLKRDLNKSEKVTCNNILQLVKKEIV